MTHIYIGAGVGLALAFATILGGWSGLLLALLFGGLGGIIGAHLGGIINAREFWDAVSRGRRG